MTQIQIRTPDDFHCHLRDGNMLNITVPHIAHNFARAIVMPNLITPITTVKQAEEYLSRIKQHIPKTHADFKPLMTLYLTENNTVEEVEKAAKHPDIFAFKLYPAGATTNSQSGISSFKNLSKIFAKLEELQFPLLIHGESIDPLIDIFDRERIFIETSLLNIINNYPKLKIVLEHVSTAYGIDFVFKAPANIAATITPHHLWYDRNDLLLGGIKPHKYCLPILKRREDKMALIAAAVSGNPKFFAGTDSAPHNIKTKESACGCAGIYHGPYGLELYAQIFAQENKLAKLENFISKFGAEFYGLPLNSGAVTLQKQPQKIATVFEYGEDKISPMESGHQIEWTSVK